MSIFHPTVNVPPLFRSRFIDAAHDYTAAYNDIKLFYEVLENGGYIFGDDYTLNGYFLCILTSPPAVYAN